MLGFPVKTFALTSFKILSTYLSLLILYKVKEQIFSLIINLVNSSLTIWLVELEMNFNTFSCHCGTFGINSSIPSL